MTAPASARSHLRAADNDDSFAARQLRIGLQHYAAGGIKEAIAVYQIGLAAAQNEPSGNRSIEIIWELHSKLGNACMVRGDLEFAAVNYRAALRLAPHLTDCWCNLGNVHLQTGTPLDAIALYGQALKLNPAHRPSLTNLVQALMATNQYLLTKGLLSELVGERPQDGEIRKQLGRVHFELNDLESALQCFRQAVVLDPRDADSMYWIGGIKQAQGDFAAAEAAYAEAARIQPLIRRPAAKLPAEFRVLALYAPFAGNLPTGYLFQDAAYDANTLALFASSQYDVELLDQDVEVVVNLISDADQADDALWSLAADLVGRIGKPAVNHPLVVRKTTRDAVADLLRGIPGCRIPRIWRQKAGADPSIETLHEALAAASTILVRPVGTHGGDEFEKIDGLAELTALLAHRPETDRYFIEYIDYRSSDGYFRKYRFILVDGQILPYHLAIAGEWKVHHDSTDMADHVWMQREEEAFLSNPATVFNASHYRALREIHARIGLEYFGVDCGLDGSGNLVVFEANASMLVHDRNEQFPYKAPFVLRIKTAFDEMLRKLAIAGAAKRVRAASGLSNM
ncbi:Tetratricopeptide repeat-containing protein [Bradyrhizobium lablabi]|uniref:Tetratricopeptide repeat-containing protein n=1 Tax=Bradyrhizobium lablabi TaxID=722472 RepID=A0A1M7ALQ9_9BRAD|nr:tetratricopeptide repeat protein [Bradyrhizobium lablabi]SHL43701.1 Tetratricopeptide repeat-containing protein [Bradyrhizobium lablabi]